MSKWVKRVLSAVLVCVLVVLFLGTLTACGNKVTPPFMAQDCVGKDYEKIASSFTDAGFKNLSLVPMEDLELSDSDKEGTVESVSIDGSCEYSIQDTFSDSSKVEIKYHSMRTATIPLSSADAESKEFDLLSQLLIDAGFSNITSNEVYDLDPDEFDVDFKNVVSVNGSTIFEVNEKFPINADVSIERHFPFEKFTLKMHIDFLSNLIFSRYDVAVLLDGVMQDTLEHGQGADYTFRLTEGKYRFTFASVDSSSVKGETTIDVKSDIDASYQISCSKDKVSVVKQYLDAKIALAENQAKIMTSETSLIDKNYKDVVAAIKKLGFTNIKEVPLYDIYFGITKPGTTKSVSIGGSTSYKRGDVFAKDVKIVVTYHMPYEDDPANKPITPNFPQESAFRAAVVAFTNRFADDVFTKDGNDYDTSKFHSYADVSGSVMDVESKGTWAGKDEKTWHVDNLKLKVREYNTTVNASLDVSFDGTNYRVFNLAGKAPSYDDNDSRFLSMKDLENESDAKLFFVVPSALVKEDRKEVSTTKAATTTRAATTVDPQIALAASKAIIESVIKDVNGILGFKAITSYSIQSTDFVYFYMSSNFASMSDRELQTVLDTINNALYRQIYGSGTPYKCYKYYIGSTLIAENKYISDPYSVKLK